MSQKILVSRYCDLLLKKSSKNPEDAELEETLNQVRVPLFLPELRQRNAIIYRTTVYLKVGGPQIADPQICGPK
jgi:hypothetical protein